MDGPAIFKKLRLNDSQQILIVNAPVEYLNLLNGLDFDKEVQTGRTGKYDFVQLFVYSTGELEQLLAKYIKAGKYDCLFWLCYPKGGGVIRSDLKRDLIRESFRVVGLKTVTQVALDETWSGLRARPFDKVGT